MRMFIVLVVGVFALAGCKSEDPDGVEEGADQCGASALQDRVGQPVADFEFDEDTRIIGPNTAVTQDYRVDRLNVEIDDNDIITRIACG